MSSWRGSYLIEHRYIIIIIIIMVINEIRKFPLLCLSLYVCFKLVVGLMSKLVNK
jgi:hypothetical protein